MILLRFSVLQKYGSYFCLELDCHIQHCIFFLERVLVTMDIFPRMGSYNIDIELKVYDLYKNTFTLLNHQLGVCRISSQEPLVELAVDQYVSFSMWFLVGDHHSLESSLLQGLSARYLQRWKVPGLVLLVVVGALGMDFDQTSLE